MRLLLDSHAFLWFCEGDATLSPVAKSAIEDPANEKYVSHATAWEIAIKAGLGKLELLLPYEELFPGTITSNGFHSLALEYRHFHELFILPSNHRDPFDRMLIAQARIDDLTVISRDAHFHSYGIKVLW